MRKQPMRWSGLSGLAILLFAVLQFGAVSVNAQQQAAKPPVTAASPADANQQTQEPASPQMLHLLVGHSLLISSPTRIKTVSIADPNIVEGIVVSPNQIQLNGKAAGGDSLLIWDENGQSQAFDLSVDIDILGLSEKIHEIFPSEPVQIETFNDVVLVSGRVSSPAVADKILEVVKSAAPKVASAMEVPAQATPEVVLQVRFADVDRTAISQLGANFLRNFGSNMPLSVSTQQFSPPGLTLSQNVTTNGNTSTTTAGSNLFTISNLLNVAIFRPDIDLAVLIQALQQQNVIQILAEPNLLTQSGKDASFLAGGQFPYPVLQNSGGQNGFAGITIQFKDFGIRLNFTPTVMPDGTIHLKVAPEVSSLDFANAVQIQGFLIPALSVNKAESEMDLRDGQSFAIAGLLDNRVTQNFSKIPGIGDIPILGKLFQSRTLNRSRNELLIVVTPHIVQPLEAGHEPKGPAMPYEFLGPTTPAKAKTTQPKQNP
ncbi:MAG TPA: pilus assembly protein N-terminal domain-containing protein [Candidatus Acidoferrales bacterium]|nr:pilus assembly protein N-terminal domain-containing protein [Candidatus Acidoferrales bacterium]